MRDGPVPPFPYLSAMRPIRRTTMSTIYRLATVMLAVCAVQCDVGTESMDYRYVYAFKPDYCGITFDGVVTDTSVVTTEVMPLKQGKGRIELSGWGTGQSDTIFVLSPIRDTLIRPLEMHGNSLAVLQVDFKANEPLIVRWRVLAKTVGQPRLTFRTKAFMDSLYIPDSNQYFSSNSRVVRDYLGLRDQVVPPGGDVSEGDDFHVISSSCGIKP